MLALIALIKLESKGPAFYAQERVGYLGDVFKVYKLRTMYVSTENDGGGVRTLTNDPRITKIGKLIRKCSLDEFPQFFNILRGDMSYIGPRPISIDEHNFVVNWLKKKDCKFLKGLYIELNRE
ncbi:MAG: sugar transferase [Ignavibacteriales bacterium]|nr:sugar transferase [Ignavibacteriales bacterium]